MVPPAAVAGGTESRHGRGGRRAGPAACRLGAAGAMGAQLREAQLLCPASSRPRAPALQSDSVFQDLEKLKARPAHLAVFLRYIFSQADPSPLVSREQPPDRGLWAPSLPPPPSRGVGSAGCGRLLRASHWAQKVQVRRASCSLGRCGGSEAGPPPPFSVWSEDTVPPGQHRGRQIRSAHVGEGTQVTTAHGTGCLGPGLRASSFSSFSHAAPCSEKDGRERRTCVPRKPRTADFLRG